MRARATGWFGSATITLLMAGTALAEPMPRTPPISGKIVSAKGGEQAVLVPDPRTRAAEVRQNLKPGDVLRTNASGTLALVFADQTQIRLGRNSVLLVKQVSGGAPSALRLQNGSLWARAPRGKTRLSVETPSATAAIRGTDWALTATETQTDLQVFDGAIEFFNDQGSLTVTTGQAATAQFGRAPSRTVVVNSTEREQMLYYVPLDGMFSSYSPSPLSPAEARAEYARTTSIPEPSRTAEDWLKNAETGYGIQSTPTVREALTRARAAGLLPDQQPRADLLEASLLAQDGRWTEALALFDRARPGLDGHRAAAADILRFVAAKRADPDAEVPPPVFDRDQPVSWLGQVYFAAYAGDLVRAKALATEAEQRFPKDPEILNLRGTLGLLLDDKAAIQQSVDAALAVDPDHALSLRLRGNYKADFLGDPKGALKDFELATILQPGSGNAWSDYGEALAERDAQREADKAMRRSVREEPRNALMHANRSIILLDQNRLKEAKAEMDEALRLDPGLSVTHTLLGRHALQKGDPETAMEEGLAASAADPAVSETLMLLGALYYRHNDYDVAMQQLDAADRLDPASSTPPLIRAAIALDRYDSDTAIRSAREALRRGLAKGGIYSNLSENRGTGSYVAGAFRSLDLDDWGRYYGDRVFDSFDANGYFDQVNSTAASPYLDAQSPAGHDPRNGDHQLFSSLIQGLALEPLAAASSNKRLQLFREQFLEASLTGSAIGANGDVRGGVSANLQGLTLGTLPFAFNVTASRSQLRGPVGTVNDALSRNVTAILGAEVTPFDRISLILQHDEQLTDSPSDFGIPRFQGFGRVDQRASAAFGAFSHEFGYRNMLQLGGSIRDGRSITVRRDAVLLGQLPIQFDTRLRNDVTSWSGNASWALGLDDLDIRIGGDVAGTRQRTRTIVSAQTPGIPPVNDQTLARDQRTFDRAYADFRYTPTGSIILQGRIATSEGAVDRNTDWQAGAAFEPMVGQWLRGAFIRETAFPASFSFAPPRVAGLSPNDAPVPSGGIAESTIVRWDAEWSAHLFTAIEYQRQTYQAVSFSRPDLLEPFCGDVTCLGPETLDYGPGRSSRLSATANLWLTGNWGVNATYAHSRSQLTTGGQRLGAIPFLPRDYGRFGLSWTNPRRIKLTAAVSYIGSRRSENLTTRLDDYVSVDATANWQFADRRFQLDLGMVNLFDAGYRVTSTLPGWGRTFTAALTARF